MTIFFQGTPAIPPVTLGDGVRCVSAPLIRFPAKTIVSGHASYPEPSDPAVSVRRMIPAIGGQFFYQAWYRSPGGPCSGNSNTTNGYQLSWMP